MLLNGEVMDEYNEKGERFKDDILLMLINGHWEDQPFRLPGKAGEPDWEVLVIPSTPTQSDEAYAGSLRSERAHWSCSSREALSAPVGSQWRKQGDRWPPERCSIAI